MSCVNAPVTIIMRKPFYLHHTICPVIIAVCVLFLSCGQSPPAGGGEISVSPWFDTLRARGRDIPLTLTGPFLDKITKSINTGNRKIPSLSSVFLSDKQPSIIFFTLQYNNGPPLITMGRGPTLADALKDAYSGVFKHHSGKLTVSAIRFDIVEHVMKPVSISPSGIQGEERFERGLTGLALSKDSGIALLPDEIVATNMIDGKGRAHFKVMRLYLAGGRGGAPGPGILSHLPAPADKNISAFPFTTMAYLCTGGVTYRLYRGRILRRRLTLTGLSHACIGGGEYLTRVQRNDGSFLYRYSPKQERELPGHNLLRHAGTLYSLLKLYEQTGRRDFLHSAKKGLRYALHYLKPFHGRGDALCPVAGRYIKLGGGGLILTDMALFQKNGGQVNQGTMERVARYILMEQDAAGRFVHRRSWPGFRDTGFRSLYYTGEALLGLISLYEINHNEKLLRAAVSGAKYCISVRDRGKDEKTLPHDHWLLMALERLYPLHPDPLFLRHTARITRAILSKQQRDTSSPERLGTYYNPPVCAATAARAEGLASAYRLLRKYGDHLPAGADRKRLLRRIASGLYLSTRFILTCRFDYASLLYLPQRKRAAGGFMTTQTDYTIRIDTVQHAISAISSCRELMKEDDVLFRQGIKDAESLLEGIWPAAVRWPSR